MIPIYEPYLPEGSLDYAHDALRSGWISSKGEYISKATKALENITGCYVQLVSNGTAATHLLAKALKYKHPHITKIIVPNNVYVAAWNSFMYEGGYELIPIDCDLLTWNMLLHDLDEVIDESTALLAVHNLGNIINIPALQRRFPNLVIIEDACEAFLGEYEDKPAGSTAYCSSYSFFGNKNITAGEGGAFITKDEDTYKYIKNTHSQGLSDEQYIHHNLGYNYRMTNIHAAILLGQLDRLTEINDKKREIAQYYRSSLSESSGFYFQHEVEGTQHSNWMVGVGKRGGSSSEIRKVLHYNNIDTRPMFYPMSSHSYIPYANRSQEGGARLLAEECFMLPSYPSLTEDELAYIVRTLKQL